MIADILFAIGLAFGLVFVSALALLVFVVRTIHRTFTKED